ncbi:two component sensor histidine kinase [Octadecabacter antarcticus 307]|uniref:histidine kinase n=1 Tax=Octadecabacter antarcticus 307 TaxID=391626 RepID=M9RBI7_9RHOB|nr:HAMP domain-containing sensor histidine kinase [Octadecabacter antarcticus]AGI69128.1 two component sensor histidine kinase [Octadecabacter antarcticus 307]
MKDLNTFWAARNDWFSSDGREQRIKDYIVLANQLVWKRQASFLAAAILAAFYFDPTAIFAYYGVVALTEMLDVHLGLQAKAWDGQDPVVGRQILKRIALNTAISGMAIAAFIINIASQQTMVGHFTPLFFLFSGSIFAAMYNSQMIGILILRLSIYGLAFLYIAFLDVFRYLPPLSSNIWLEFFTIIFVLYFIGDISVKFYVNQQERLEQMKLIQEENERTKAALEVKSQFLSTVSHELRTPLTSIIGSLELIKADPRGLLPDNLKPMIGIAARNAQRLAALIDDLLDLQKIEAGEMAFHFKPVDANDLVYEAVESTAGYASKLGIHVTTAPCGEDCQIAGDRNRLVQVMSNLLSNALKFSDKGGAVKVRVETLSTRIRISVHDEGVGIPRGAKDCVFGKFSQVDSSDARKVGGTGLGLNITKQIIGRHNGTVDYVSELGVGSTFYIEFDRLTDGGGPSAVLEPLANPQFRVTGEAV